MNFAIVDHDIDASAVEVEKQYVTEKNVAKSNDTSINKHAMEDSPYVIPTTHQSHVPVEEIVHNKEVEDAGQEAPQLDTKLLSGDEDVANTIQQDFEKHVSNSVIVDTSDSTTLTSISSDTEAVINALVYKLSNEPINVEQLSVIIPLQLTGGDDFLFDSQLPTQLSVKESTHNLDTKTPASHNSPYLTAFGFSDKGKGKIGDVIHPYTPFEGCGITYQVLSVLIQEYSQWMQKGLLQSHANNTQEHIARADVVSVYERSIKDVINEFFVPAVLPWHLVDEVYIPVNCDKEFHWVLIVVVLRKRLIRIYDSSLGSRKKVQSDEIKQLSVILPNYLQDSRFFDKTDIIDRAALNAYKDNKTGELLGPQHSFYVEFAQDIMQQESDSISVLTYVAAFFEFLNDEINVPSIPFQSDYLRSRYATLL
ncbi:hypothetical protein H5410_041990 [Solanum commersonii]|uniref:Ubiquitin-like protease family profile domain-containing protein n=1 Tax=Solanum commersonii TaxID=4109 RepID=A0A9J5XW79_SOLCO|nr:hypothetical protein H5410_041990 [Solanum commersonii]